MTATHDLINEASKGIEERSTQDLIDRYMGYRHPDSGKFRTIVDMMTAWMIDHKIPPDELRDAAYIASIKFLQMHPVNLLYKRDDINNG